MPYLTEENPPAPHDAAYIPRTKKITKPSLSMNYGASTRPG
jgi:hypothetical protein